MDLALLLENESGPLELVREIFPHGTGETLLFYEGLIGTKGGTLIVLRVANPSVGFQIKRPLHRNAILLVFCKKEGVVKF